MATSKAYYLPETRYDFLETGGDAALTLTSLAALNGRQSAQLDFGAGVRPFMFRWRAWVKFATTPVVGESIEIYIKTSDGTHLDNDDGVGDIAVSAEDKLKNLRYVGSIVVDQAGIVEEYSASGVFTIYERYVHLVFWNSTADGLSATAADHGAYLQAIPLQGQAS
ncbi:hypothetical protein OAE19_05250 [Porticoccaceae bacterium]|nr:hypothetical protein [Porticoccaceae bacterium]